MAGKSSWSPSSRDTGRWTRSSNLRGDAAFASPDVYEYLEDKGILYAIRLKTNNNLYHEIEHLMTRPVGRPSRKPKVFFHSFSYRAGSWKKSRRVIAKVEWHIDELFPRIGFIVTNMTSSPEAVVHFYNHRSTCEQYIREGKSALTWTRLSCSRFSSNRVRLALFVLAYNLGNFLRRFALPKEVSHWSLTSIQLKLIKIGAKIISHSRMTGLIKDGRPTMLSISTSRAEGRRPMRKLYVGIDLGCKTCAGAVRDSKGKLLSLIHI